MTTNGNERINPDDFTTRILVDQTPREVFDAVNNVRGWWSQDIQGSTEKLNDEFVYVVEGIHYAKMRLIEVIPERRVVWLVVESTLSFVKDKQEWTGTKILFDISRQGDKTRLVFTHQGLIPKLECHDICVSAWTDYVHDSLFKLITTGKGDPNLEGRTIKTPAIQ